MQLAAERAAKHDFDRERQDAKERAALSERLLNYCNTTLRISLTSAADRGNSTVQTRVSWAALQCYVYQPTARAVYQALPPQLLSQFPKDGVRVDAVSGERGVFLLTLCFHEAKAAALKRLREADAATAQASKADTEKSTPQAGIHPKPSRKGGGAAARATKAKVKGEVKVKKEEEEEVKVKGQDKKPRMS